MAEKRLDLDKIVELSVASSGFRNEVVAQLDQIRKLTTELAEEFNGTADAEAYIEAFKTIAVTADNIQSILDKIVTVTGKKADVISQALKQKGGEAAAEAMKRHNEAMKART